MSDNKVIEFKKPEKAPKKAAEDLSFDEIIALNKENKDREKAERLAKNKKLVKSERLKK